MKIEIILVLALALVFIIDFLVRKKKNSTSEIEKSVQKKTEKSYSKPNILKKIILGILIVFTIAGPLIFDLWIYMTLDDLNAFLDNPVLYLEDLYYFQYLFLNTYLIHVIFLVITFTYGVYLFRKDIFNKAISYIKDKPRNFAMFFFAIVPLKVVFHYLFYRKYCGGYNRIASLRTERGPCSFGSHLDDAFDPETYWMYLVVLFSMIFLVWFFNDKIKAR